MPIQGKKTDKNCEPGQKVLTKHSGTRKKLHFFSSIRQEKFRHND